MTFEEQLKNIDDVVLQDLYELSISDYPHSEKFLSLFLRDCITNRLSIDSIKKELEFYKKEYRARGQKIAKLEERLAKQV